MQNLFWQFLLWKCIVEDWTFATVFSSLNLNRSHGFLQLWMHRADKNIKNEGNSFNDTKNAEDEIYQKKLWLIFPFIWFCSFSFGGINQIINQLLGNTAVEMSSVKAKLTISQMFCIVQNHKKIFKIHTLFSSEITN